VTVKHGWGASLTKSQERDGGSPAALAKNSGSNTTTAHTREAPPYSPRRALSILDARSLSLVLGLHSRGWSLPTASRFVRRQRLGDA
jgi:hypothetical protein